MSRVLFTQSNAISVKSRRYLLNLSVAQRANANQPFLNPLPTLRNHQDQTMLLSKIITRQRKSYVRSPNRKQPPPPPPATSLKTTTKRNPALTPKRTSRTRKSFHQRLSMTLKRYPRNAKPAAMNHNQQHYLKCLSFFR